MEKRRKSQLISMIFAFIFCFFGVQAEFYQPYAFFSCISIENTVAADEEKSFAPTAEDMSRLSAAGAGVAQISSPADDFSLPDYSLRSGQKESSAYFQNKSRENGRTLFGRFSGTFFDGFHNLRGCAILAAPSYRASDFRINSEKITIAYVHNKDGKKS